MVVVEFVVHNPIPVPGLLPCSCGKPALVQSVLSVPAFEKPSLGFAIVTDLKAEQRFSVCA